MLNPMTGLMLCIHLLPIISLFSQFFLSDIDWFLEGRQSLLATGLIGLSAFIHILAFRQIPRWHSIYAESQTELPPAGWNYKSWTSWMKSLSVAPSGMGRRGWLNRAFNNHLDLDTLLAQRGPHPFWRLSIAANAMNRREIFKRAILFFAVISMGMLILNYLGSGDPRGLSSALQNFGYMMLIFVDSLSLGFITNWRSRRPMLGCELLRPACRDEFVRQLFLAVWSDLQPMLAVHLVATVVAAIFWAPGTPSLFFPLVAGYFVFRGLSLYAAILFLMTIRRDWLAAMLTPLAWVLLSGGALYLGLSLTVFWQSSRFSLLGLGIYFAGSAIIVMLLIRLKAYWQRIELA